MSDKPSRRGLAAAAKTQIRQVVSLAIVVLVLVGIIYTVAGQQYGKAEFVARFLFFRQPDIKQKPVQIVDLRAMIATTPEMMTAGKQIFATNCTPCHGDDGFGNGPRSAGLNPPPRNFHQPKFRYGTDILTLFHTVTHGSPGTAMPSFANVLTPEERMDVVHFVQHWIPDPAKVTPAEIAALPAPSAPPSGPMPLPKLNPVPEGPRIPIALAMKLMARPAPQDPPAPAVADNAQGAALYATQCQSCHGAAGEGEIPVEMLTSHPYAEVEAQSFRAPLRPEWRGNEAAFAHLVAHGLPGRMMPGFGTLTQPQMDALYAHVLHLAGGAANANAAAAGTPVASAGTRAKKGGRS